MTNEARQTLSRVVVATDFTPGGATAARRALSLPLAPGATVSLLHVVPERVEPSYRPAVIERARALLVKAASDARGAGADGPASVHLEHDVAVGAPFVEIIRHARSRGADLVVLGRHGAAQLRDAFVGSTAERVIRKGDVPVLLAHEASAVPYRRALVAFDLSDASPRVVELALALLPPSVRTVHLVHARHVAFQGWLGSRGLEEYRRDGDEQVAAAAERIAAPWRERGVECRLVVREGDPRMVILGEAVRERCDVVVLGTHARSGVAHALLGSVAEWLVRSAPCDVAVTRPARFTFELP